MKLNKIFRPYNLWQHKGRQLFRLPAKGLTKNLVLAPHTFQAGYGIGD